MNIDFRYGRETIGLAVPDNTAVYAAAFPAPAGSAEEQVLAAISRPAGVAPLRAALAQRRSGPVVVVVSDMTRPIPYRAFLPGLLAELESAGVPRGEIVVLIATGMHRASTAAEREQMFGPQIVRDYRIVAHDAEDDEALAALDGRSAAGARVRLNRQYVEAGFRLVTGLVEPHFMAGFSGGRKAVCPGLSALQTIERFHGAVMLDSAAATNAKLAGNPCHEEACSVARLAPPDFTVNVVLDGERRLVRAFAGGLEPAHEAACAFVRECACPAVEQPADVVLTSSGGDPLDATFYQCVKGFVSCLPAVRGSGTILAFGGCAEGVGSREYEQTMRGYAGRWMQFLLDIRKPGLFTKDQWQFQMHSRALMKVDLENLHFVTDGLPAETLAQLSVQGHAVAPCAVQSTLQALLDKHAGEGTTLAVLPDGPYCAPVVGGL